MDKKPSIDLEIVVPILLGVFSIMGICVIAVFGWINNSRVPIQVDATQTPPRFIFLGTEPGAATLTPENTSTPIVLNTPAPLLNTKTSVSTSVIILPSLTLAQTSIAFATITPTIPFVLSKFDDTSSSLLYDGDWTSQSNVNGAHQNTLHISFTVGSTVSFTATGQRVIISYQSGPSLGRISINLDGLVFEVDQSNTKTQIENWQSQLLVKAAHTVTIEHISGGSVNIDSITIPDISTSTPTLTLTPTP